jgi:RNA polymerase sigma-70 factor (ECF subfamily)
VLSDPEIIRRVCIGDTNAYRFLVERYKDRAFSLAAGITKEDVTAEEAVQDAFLKAYQALPDFEGRSKFSTWFYRIVVNEALGKMRKKDQWQDYGGSAELSDRQLFDVAETLEYCKRDDQVRYIRSTLDRMKPGDAVVLELYYLEELNLDEIASVTGYTRTNVKTILHRARQRFYAILKDQLQDEVRSIV